MDLGLWEQTDRLSHIAQAAFYAKVSPWAVLNVTLARLATLVGQVTVNDRLVINPAYGLPAVIVGDETTCKEVGRASCTALYIPTSDVEFVAPDPRQNRSADVHAAQFDLSAPVFTLVPDQADVWKNDPSWANRMVWGDSTPTFTPEDIEPPELVKWEQPTELFDFETGTGGKAKAVYHTKPSFYGVKILVAAALASLEERETVQADDWDRAALVMQRSRGVKEACLGS